MDRSPALGKYSHKKIEQVYLVVARYTEIRIRKSNGECTLTLKIGKGEDRFEKEVPIPLRGYLDLSRQSKLRLLKTRYKVPYKKYVIEVDCFVGKLKGLKIAEIEFDSDKEASSFVPPEWLGREITNDQRFRNSTLALRGVPEKSQSKSIS